MSFLTLSSLGDDKGQVIELPTLAPGTVINQAMTIPVGAARSTQDIDVAKEQAKQLDRVPWPHQFFRSFMTAPRVPTPAYYQNMSFTDPKLVQSGYFRNLGEGTDKDMAQYLFDNQDAVNEHFATLVKEKVAADQKKAEEAKKDAKKRGIIGAIVGVVVGIVTLGIGTIAVLAVTAAQVAWSVYEAKRMSAEQLKNVKELLAYLKVPPQMMDTFRMWVISKVEAPPEVPPLPANVVVSSKYTFFVNGNYVSQNGDIQPGMVGLLGLSLVGDRITVVDQQSKVVAAVYLRVKDGFNGIPPDKARLAQAMGPNTAVLASGGTPGAAGTTEIPVEYQSTGVSPLVWLAAIPVALLAMKK